MSNQLTIPQSKKYIRKGSKAYGPLPEDDNYSHFILDLPFIEIDPSFDSWKEGEVKEDTEFRIENSILAVPHMFWTQQNLKDSKDVALPLPKKQAATLPQVVLDAIKERFPYIKLQTITIREARDSANIRLLELRQAAEFGARFALSNTGSGEKAIRDIESIIDDGNFNDERVIKEITKVVRKYFKDGREDIVPGVQTPQKLDQAIAFMKWSQSVECPYFFSGNPIGVWIKKGREEIPDTRERISNEELYQIFLKRYDDFVPSDNGSKASSLVTPQSEPESRIGQYENLYEPNCIRTVSGIYIKVFNPTPDMICIEDIAHSLSYQCRFGGHLPQFYSVAQHSLNCSYLIDDPKLKLAALLHDASEAYLLDIPRPIKMGLSNYKEIEDRLMKVIADKYGFNWPLDKEIKKVDETMLQIEWDCLMLNKRTWDFKTVNEVETKRNFLSMFKYYSMLSNGENLEGSDTNGMPKEVEAGTKKPC